MNPYTNPPSPEPIRVEIQYRLIPEQEQFQRRISGQVRSMNRIFVVVWLFLLVVVLAGAGFVAFMIVHAISSASLP
jgi:hypothetical protein